MEKSMLARADLNLLVALRALLRTRHVTQAAAQVGITQPAMSRSLHRLRELFNDPLLVRGSRGYELTPRAEALAPLLESTLKDLEQLLQPMQFDPAEARGTLTLCTTDFGSLYYIPYFLELLRSRAPGIDVEVRNWDARAIQLIEEGEADIGLAIIDAPPPRMRFRRMGQDQLVCAMHSQHPLAKGRLDLDAYCAHEHIHVPTYLAPEHDMDRQLAALGKRRQIAAEIPHFIAALTAASQGRFVVTLPELFVSTMVDTFGFDLVARPLPLSLPPIHYGILWHERGQRDPAQRWMRELMVSGFGEHFQERVKLFQRVLDKGLPGAGDREG